jgi:urease accessory protein
MKAQLEIAVAVSNGHTYPKQLYFTPPFKVANITGAKGSACLELMIMTASPGILDEDEYHVNILLEKHAQLHLQTQAYQRLFQMQKGAAQYLSVTLQEGSAFVYLPHPTVPHQQSSFTAINNFYLAEHCHFVYGEILTPGRKLNGENFLLQRYHSDTCFYLNNKLIIRENLLLQPSLIAVAEIGQLEGFSHQASLIIWNPKLDLKNARTQICDLLNTHTAIEYGVTTAPANALLVRLLGNGSEILHKLLKQINKLTEQLLATEQNTSTTAP